MCFQFVSMKASRELSEFIEGLMATDMKKTGDDLAMFFKDAV